jgi:hypothetical protein
VTVGHDKNQDWAQALVAEIRDCGLEGDADSTRLFVAAFEGGNSADAWKKYADGATVYASVDGLNKLVVFTDGSVYCDSLEGIDRFFPSVGKLRQENPEEASRFGV